MKKKHQIDRLKEVGGRMTYICLGCDKRWGPYDEIQWSETCPGPAVAGIRPVEVPPAEVPGSSTASGRPRPSPARPSATPARRRRE